MGRDAAECGTTSATLLARLRQFPADEAAWRDFVGRYGARIFSWCRAWGLQESDARDVSQDILLRLAAKLRSFEYDPARSFRGWLRTLTHNALCDFQEDRRRRPAGGECGQLLEVPAREDLVSRLEHEFDREVMEEAEAHVRLRVQPNTWEAFRLTALEGWTGARAAAHLGMKVTSVFAARSKVQRLLREQIARLDPPDDRT